MVTCVNCSRDALYTYQVSGSYIIHYCQSHLPKFLVNKRNAGLLPLIIPAPVVETPKSSKKKDTVEEPVVEETPVEETPTEE